MPPTKRKLKPKKPDSPEVKQAWRETWKSFKGVRFTSDGKERVGKIFERTIKRFIVARSTPKKPRWTGALRRFVLCCVDQIALELAETSARRRVDGKDVQRVSVKWMTRFKGVSRVCGNVAKVIEPSAQQGEVCGTFLDSI